MRKIIYDLEVKEKEIFINFSKVKLNHEYRVIGKIDGKEFEAVGIFIIMRRIKVFVDNSTNETYEFVIKNSKKGKYKIKALFFAESGWEQNEQLKELSIKEIHEKAVNNDILKNYDSKCVLTNNPYVVRQCIEDEKRMICVCILLQNTYACSKNKKEPINTSIIKRINALSKTFETKNTVYYWE